MYSTTSSHIGDRVKEYENFHGSSLGCDYTVLILSTIGSLNEKTLVEHDIGTSNDDS